MEQNSIQKHLALPGTVFALGDKAAAAAKLYARLTGRHYQVCASVTDLTASLNDVVVCMTDELTPHLMYKLYVNEQSGGVPGLIFAATPALLELVCRSQAARLTRTGKVNPQRIFVHPTLDFSAVTRDTDLFLSGQEPIETLLPVLSSGASILSIFAHSDGIALDVSHTNILCPFVGARPAPDGGLRPSCQVMDRCTKFPMTPPLQEAKNAGWILPLKILRAEIAIIAACAAVRLRDGVVDPAYGLVSSLLHQADCGAVITTWRKEPATADGFHLNTLINELSAGVAVGVAVAALNRSPFCVKFGARFCVVGDPCFALPEGTSYSQLPVLTEPVLVSFSESLTDKKKETARAALLRDAVLKSLKSNPAYDVSKGEKLASDLTAHAVSGIANGVQSKALAEMDHRLLEFLSAFPWLPGFFQHFCWIERVSENVACPVCFAPSRVSHLAFPKHSAEVREVTSCSSCGDTRDMPAGWQIALDLTRLKNGIFSLSGVPPGTQLLVCIVNFWGSLYRAYQKQASEDGSFSFQVPIDLPPVPMFCRILFARSLELGAFSFKLRQMSDGRYQGTTPYAGMPAIM